MAYVFRFPILHHLPHPLRDAGGKCGNLYFRRYFADLGKLQVTASVVSDRQTYLEEFEDAREIPMESVECTVSNLKDCKLTK